jgi:hypothetical protein
MQRGQNAAKPTISCAGKTVGFTPLYPRYELHRHPGVTTETPTTPILARSRGFRTLETAPICIANE